MPWQKTVILTLVAANSFVLCEWLLSKLRRMSVYSFAGTITNLGDYTVYLIVAAIYGYTEYLLLTWLQLEFAVQKLVPTWWYWLFLILADDFCFYWFHRLSHKLGILWMSHVVHHSSNEFNLSIGLRQTWFPFLGMFFWLPLAFAGFSPVHILVIQAISLTYQFLMHTQLVNLPPTLGFVFNTPSHHRVHHGLNAEYIDKNFAGVLILWDRIFRTFEPERAKVKFGIDDPPPRGEVLFVQLWGPWIFLRDLFRKRRAITSEADVYAKQSTSTLFALFFLGLSFLLFFLAITKPRWFI